MYLMVMRSRCGARCSGTLCQAVTVKITTVDYKRSYDFTLFFFCVFNITFMISMQTELFLIDEEKQLMSEYFVVEN